ncbi:MAG: HepT-like ribonuclease domain-containing protein [Caulobacteraceae bacterium]
MTKSRSATASLTDILEAVEVIEAELRGVTIEALEADKRKRWLVERGPEIISEASRRLPDAMKSRHPGIPWPKVAGIGNILRHEYERVAADVLWRLVKSDLAPLETACRAELGSSPDAVSGRGPARD